MSTTNPTMNKFLRMKGYTNVSWSNDFRHFTFHTYQPSTKVIIDNRYLRLVVGIVLTPYFYSDVVSK